MKILIVEDDSSDQDILRYRLDPLGAVLTFCEGAREAKHLLQSGGFDMAITDLGLPDGDGVTLAGFVACTLVLISGSSQRLLDVSKTTGAAAAQKNEYGYQLLVSMVRATMQTIDSKCRAERLEKLQEGVL